jgi:hypothetical protein
MAKTWVLDTETKGTGAEVVPIEKARAQPRRERDLALVELGGPAKAEPAEAPRAPTLFKVVDVLGARTLAENVGGRAAQRARRPYFGVVSGARALAPFDTRRGEGPLGVPGQRLNEPAPLGRLRGSHA